LEAWGIFLPGKPHGTHRLWDSIFREKKGLRDILDLEPLITSLRKGSAVVEAKYKPRS
jgi:hypothetical protein